MKFAIKSAALAATIAAVYSAATKGPNRNPADMASLAAKLYPGFKTEVREIKSVTEPWRIQGDKVVLTEEEILEFHTNGHISLPPILNEEGESFHARC